MTATLSPPMFLQFLNPNNSGASASGYQLFTYLAGTTTKQATWTDSTQAVQNANPVVLDSGGVGYIWGDPALAYKFVWALPGDSDPPTSPIRTVDNLYFPVTVGALQSIINAPILYSLARSAAEISAGVTPVNYSYPPGSLLRYGADPTGLTDSAVPLAAAIAANSYVFDDFPDGGTYQFGSSITIRSVLHIRGATKTIAGSTGRGTTFVLRSSAGNTATLLHATAFISDFEVENITFTWQDFTKPQRALQFELDCRSSRIRNCAFIGSAVSTTQSAGINFVGGGTFTGDVTIERNYFAAVQIGIAMAGSCSTVRVISNEMYCNTVIPSSYAINNVSTGGGGLVIAFNTFEQWGQAIHSTSGGICQVKNYFEGNVTWDMNWETSTNNSSFGDYTTASPLASFSYNNTSANVVLSAFGYFIDSGTLKAYRGFTELGLSVAMGYGTTRTFAAGNYGVNTGGPWTVASATTDSYSRKGGEMTFSFDVTGALTGGTTVSLTIAIPGGLFPAVRTTNVVQVTNGGANAFGLAIADPSAAVVSIYCTATGTTAWTAGTVGVHGQLTIRILS